jgi:hypothetical protein
MDTQVVMVSDNNNKSSVFEIVDGPDAGQKFNVNAGIDVNDCFDVLDDMTQGMIQDASDEIGLNDFNEVPTEDKAFPIAEV